MSSLSASAPFSFSTIVDFDAHIAREIRGYEILSKIVIGLADAIIEADSNVYDIGCSTGRLINCLATEVAAEADESRKRNVTFIGIEPNAHFAEAFAPATESVHFWTEHVTSESRFENASLVTSLFTLQFVPVRERADIVRNVYQGLNSNGVFVLAEKVYMSDTRIERLINDRHIDFKREGSSAEEILDKDKRLRAIMRPLTLAANYQLLKSAGFVRYETFWRVNNFVAIVAVKS